MIRTVSVANLGPFRGEQTAHLGEGLLSIEGRYSDKPGESNRAGKTAFIDLIRFALYGEHRYQAYDKYIHRQANPRNDPVYVSLEMEDPDGTVYHIIREFDYASQRFVLRIPESASMAEMKQADLQKEVIQLLGCDYENAIRTWLILQEDAKGIMNLSIADRKRFLLDMFAPNSFPWDSYHAEANSRLTVCKVRQSEVLSRITNYRNRLYELSEQDFKVSIASIRQEILDLQGRQTEIQRSLKDLETLASPEALDELRRKSVKQNQVVADLYRSLLASRKTLDKARRDVEAFNAKSKALSELESQRKKLSKQVEKLRIVETEQEYARVYDKHKALAFKLATVLEQYKSVEGFSGVCPTTGMNCPSGASISSMKASLQEDIASMTQDVDSYQTSMDKLVALMDSHAAVKKDLSIVEANISAVENALTYLEGASEFYDEQVEKNAQDEATYSAMKAEADSLKAEVESRSREQDLTYNRRVRELKQEHAAILSKLSELDNRLKLLLADEQRKDILEQDLADAQKEYAGLERKERILRAMKPMLSQDGVPFQHLLASVTGFETEINQALVDLGTDLTVYIEPYTTTNSYASVCMQCGYEYPKGSRVTRCPVVGCNATRQRKRKETLEIRLRGNVFDVTFDEDSGGGQQWVAMGIRFALFNVMRNRGMMKNIDFWSLDEVFAPLSDVSKFNMLNFLENIRQTYDIRQLFLITHTDISAVVPPAVVIERSDALQESVIVA